LGIDTLGHGSRVAGTTCQADCKHHAQTSQHIAHSEINELKMNQALILAHPNFKTSSEGLRLGDSFKKSHPQ
jgi:hypothetical protein